MTLTKNQTLESLFCGDNQLISLNVKSGYNTTLSRLGAKNNPNLSCIEVDDAAYSFSNWKDVDAGVRFSIN